MQPSRRAFHALACRSVGLGALAAASLVGCGFGLRAAQKFPFKSLYTGPILQSPLLTELARQITAAGDVVVLTDQREVERADVVFELLQDQRERVVAGRTSSGSVREFVLRLNLRFRLRSRDGTELIPDTLLQAQADVSYSETQALSKDQEELLLFTNLGKELVSQILRRMGTLKPL